MWRRAQARGCDEFVQTADEQNSRKQRRITLPIPATGVIHVMTAPAEFKENNRT
jgi:hypothetical protein